MRRLFACAFIGIFLLSSSAFAEQTQKVHRSQAEKMKLTREQITEDAAFVRKVDSDPTMTPDQRKAAIQEFLAKQNEKI